MFVPNPRHSVTSYAPACAPQIIVYFRCLLESLHDFRSSACCFRAFRDEFVAVLSRLGESPCAQFNLLKE